MFKRDRKKYQKNKKTTISEKKKILIIGGSQGAKFFDETITKTIIKLSKTLKIQVLQQVIDLNSKEIFLKNESLKLTEMEIKMIIYISNSLNAVSINELQEKIWGYSQGLETHTVETHIHRLRKKVLDSFKDKNFIVSTKNGYQIIQKK